MKKDYRGCVENLNKILNRYEALESILKKKDIRVCLEYPIEDGEDDGEDFDDDELTFSGNKRLRKVYIDIPAIRDEVISSLAILKTQDEDNLDRLIEFLSEGENEGDVI